MRKASRWARAAHWPPAWVSSREHVPVPALAEHPVRQVLAHGQVMVLDVDDPHHAELFGPAEAPLSARALGVRSAVLAPLAGRAGSLGVLAVAMGPSDRKFGDDDVELVPIMGRLAGLAIENIEALQRQRLIANRLRRAGRVAVSVNAADDIARIGTAVIDVAGSDGFP